MAMASQQLPQASPLRAVRRDGRMQVRRACEECGVMFWTRIRRDGALFQRFCSRRCASLSQRSETPSLKVIRKRANRAVERALAAGNLRRQPCEICGDLNAHAHHEDYSKPLEIRWLCRKHHNGLHHLGRRRPPETGRRISAALKRRNAAKAPFALVRQLHAEALPLLRATDGRLSPEPAEGPASSVRADLIGQGGCPPAPVLATSDTPSERIR